MCAHTVCHGVGWAILMLDDSVCVSASQLQSEVCRWRWHTHDLYPTHGCVAITQAVCPLSYRLAPRAAPPARTAGCVRVFARVCRVWCHEWWQLDNSAHTTSGVPTKVSCHTPDSRNLKKFKDFRIHLYFLVSTSKILRRLKQKSLNFNDF